MNSRSVAEVRQNKLALIFSVLFVGYSTWSKEGIGGGGGGGVGILYVSHTVKGSSIWYFNFFGGVDFL